MLIVIWAKMLFGALALLLGLCGGLASTINILNGYTKRTPVLVLSLMFIVIGLICVL
ncbi:hypothetical protein ACSW9V_15360 (plasmid) [Clostridium perfringens]|uniref:hypothetical protein n=1 Tax=Clostridium perfringens TaxID=1502 RepID=UPI0013A60B46|nr:hypothetical protein [Clostridium perfringens]EGT0690616.1 hypothetical protein [Clostridium perfringens]EGT0694124.1 hypothetical protein [Clostridium perfringens]EGT0696432.1 hypothetical protein [Clostridium perfringens]MDU3376261.1 hypothetical protein [Clostridium perfringens]MDU3534217.1 hypothetical protein [Clostridium perfringens]